MEEQQMKISERDILDKWLFIINTKCIKQKKKWKQISFFLFI